MLTSMQVFSESFYCKHLLRAFVASPFLRLLIACMGCLSALLQVMTVSSCECEFCGHLLRAVTASTRCKHLLLAFPATYLLWSFTESSCCMPPQAISFSMCCSYLLQIFTASSYCKFIAIFFGRRTAACTYRTPLLPELAACSHCTFIAELIAIFQTTVNTNASF